MHESETDSSSTTSKHAQSAHASQEHLYYREAQPTVEPIVPTYGDEDGRFFVPIGGTCSNRTCASLLPCPYNSASSTPSHLHIPALHMPTTAHRYRLPEIFNAKQIHHSAWGLYARCVQSLLSLQVSRGRQCQPPLDGCTARRNDFHLKVR